MWILSEKHTEIWVKFLTTNVFGNWSKVILEDQKINIFFVAPTMGVLGCLAISIMTAVTVTLLLP